MRLYDLWRGDAGHLRAHGNPAPLRDDRAAPWPVRAGPVRARVQGDDGCRDSAGNRVAGIVVALIAPRSASTNLAASRAHENAFVRRAGDLVFAMIVGLGLAQAKSLQGCGEYCVYEFWSRSSARAALDTFRCSLRTLHVFGLWRAGREHPAARDRHQIRRADVLDRDGNDRRGKDHRPDVPEGTAGREGDAVRLLA